MFLHHETDPSWIHCCLLVRSVYLWGLIAACLTKIRVVYGNGLISENRHQYINKYLIFLSMFSVLMITILVIANSLLFPHYILVYTLAICLLGLSIVAALVALVSLGVKVLLVIKRRLADSATKLLCFFL